LSFLILPFIILITKFFAFVLTLVRYQQQRRGAGGHHGG
jgi:hypothetical protein